MRKVYALILIALLLGTVAPFVATGATYGKDSITQKKITDRYKNSKLNVLVVPGHEPGYGGTMYGHIYERDIVLMIADELQKLLEEDKRITTYRTRDANGWTADFAEYFEKEWNTITEWIDESKYKTGILAEKGKIERVGGSIHNDAAPDVAKRLYGINKWGNENNIDVALHLHINDVPRPDLRGPGPYVGFAIYVPEKQYSNAEASKKLGEKMKNRIEEMMMVSNLHSESGGVVEEQDLIAIGSFNTSNAASILIEYGYIYESQYANEELQREFAKKIAKQTYLGLQDFLRKK
jgi:N-acetylmuramoyl-L-alanine amidase